MLLSSRLLTKLPVSESIQMQMDAALQGMKIDPSSLHCSKAVCEEFDNLREQLLIYFAIDKFIGKKKEEQAEVKEWREEIESLLGVFEKNREYLDKNAKMLQEQAMSVMAEKHPQFIK
jgi:hypothetical protein